MTDDLHLTQDSIPACPLTRRQLLRWAGAAALATSLAGTGRDAHARSITSKVPEPGRLRIALLHCAPCAGSLDANRALIEQGLTIAIRHGAHVLLTPELALSGYGFRSVIGLDWIPVMPDPWIRRLGRRAGRAGVIPVIGTPERDEETGLLHNSLLVLTADGDIIGRHRKVNVLPAPIENWATPGDGCAPVPLHGIPAGLLICADAYTAALANQAAARGAQLLLSGAAWTPGRMGPHGAWEARSRETGCPLLVCNRTGVEPGSNFERCRTVGIAAGERLFTTISGRSCVLITDLNGPAWTPLEWKKVPLY